MVNGGLDNLLQNELQLLASEAKRKFIPVKETAEQLIGLIKACREKQQNLTEEIRTSKDSLNFFFASCESRSTKLSGIALNILQKLVIHDALCEEHQNVPKIVNHCGDFIYSNSEIQLKVLQTLLLLFTHYPVEVRGKSVAKTFDICFQLANLSNPIIKNTAGATLKQLTSLLFEKIEEELETTHPNHTHVHREVAPISASTDTALVNLKPMARDAYLLFRDLCALVKHDPPCWLATEGISKMLGLDLMESVISANSALFMNLPEFLNLMKDKVCPMALYFTDRTSFAHSMRTNRLVWIIIRDFHLALPMECEIFMSMLIKLFDAENLVWQRALAAEILRLIFIEESVFYSLFEHFDMQPDAPNIVTNMTQGMADYMQRTMIEKRKQHKMDINQATADQSASTTVFGDALSLKVHCLEQFDKINHPPSLSDMYPLWLVLQCIFYLGDHLLGQLAMVFPQKAGTKTLRDFDIERHEKKKEIEMFLKITEALWASALIILSATFHVSMDENTLTQVFKSYFAWIRGCGILEIITARDAILTQLCRLSVWESELAKLDGDRSNVIFTRTNLLALRCLLNVANVLSEVLEIGWIPVLETLLLADRLSESFLSHRKQSMTGLLIVSSQDRLVNENEVLLFRQSLNKLFENIQFLSHRGFFYLIKGLCMISSEDSTSGIGMMSLYSRTKTTKDRAFTQSIMTRLRDCCLFNLDRLCSTESMDSWNLVTTHLLKLCLSSNVVVRGQATETLTAILRSIIESESEPKPKDLDSTTSRHEHIFEILKSMTDVHWIDVRKSSLLTAKVIIEASGHYFSKNVWRSILNIVGQLVLNPARSKYLDAMKIGFQILQLISNEFLMNLDIQELGQCIENMGAYGSRVQDLNINLGAIGLLWNVADYLWSRNNKELENTWDPKVIDALYVDLLSQLAKLCENGHPDVRNGAAHTLFRAFTVHGRAFQPLTLRSSFDQIMYPLMEMVMGPCPEISTGRVSNEEDETMPFQDDNKDIRLSAHHSKESLQNQWEETQVLVVSGVAKLFEEYLAQLIRLEDILGMWKVYIALVSSLVQSGSQEVVAGTMDSFCNMLNMTSKELLGEQQHLKPLWKEAFTVWKSMVQVVFMEKVDHYNWTQKVVVSFASCFRGIYTLLQSDFTPSDFRVIFNVFHCCIFVKSPDAFHDDADMTSAQKTIIELLEMIEITEERVSIILLYYLDLCNLPFCKQDLRQTYIANEAKQDNARTFLALSRVSIQHIPSIFIQYSKGTSLYIDGTFQSCIKVLGEIMNRKYKVDFGKRDDAIWKIAANSFRDISNAGAHALHALEKGVSSDMRNYSMKLIIGLLSEHLLSTSFDQISLDQQEFEADQYTSLGIFHSCFYEILPLMFSYDISLVTSLLTILYEGSILDPVENLHLMKIVTVNRTYLPICNTISHGCLEILFNITEIHSPIFSTGDHAIYQNQVYQIALSMLEQRSQSILKIASQAIEQSDGFPLPTTRSLELKYLLERLSDWKPLEQYKHQLFRNNRSLFLSLLKHASKDWIWTQDIYRCLEIMP